MKHPSQIILFIFFYNFFSNVQAQTYNLNVSNEPFGFLQNPQSAVQGPWDLLAFQIPLGFDFHFFDITSDSLFSAENSFGGYTSLNQDEENLYMMIHFYAFLIDRGYQQDSAASPIYYKTEGLPGQRIFTLEYNNAGIFNGLQDFNGVFLDYINIQVKLYESSGDIEYHFGPYSIQEDPEIVFDGYPGPFIGLFADCQNVLGGDIGEVILLSGDAMKPTLVTDPFSVVNWPIPENTVYRFSRTTATSDPNFTHEDLMISPNPANSYVHLSRTGGRVEVIDATSRMIYNEYIEEDNLDVSGFTPGIYYLRMISKDKISTGKFVRQ